MKIFRAALLCLALAFGVAPAGATVSTGVASTTALGNGATTQFSFYFIGVSPAYLAVSYTDPTGVQTTLTQGSGPTQYQVTLNAATTGQSWGIGGVITYNPSGTPIPAGSSLTVARTIPLVQAVSLQNQSSYGQVAKSAERAIDLLEMQVQQISTTFARAITANVANLTPPAQLPPAAQAANFGLCFDGTGLNIIACAQIPTGTVSSAMQPIVSAPTLSAAQTAFGLKAAGREGIGAGLQDDGAGNLRATFTTAQDGASTAVTAAFHLTSRVANGPFTYTLPRANTLWSGFGFWVFPAGGPISVAINASDSFLGQSSGASVTLPVGSPAYITTDGATFGTWLVQMGGLPSLPAHFPGEVIKMRGLTCPVGTLIEDGSAISRTTYAALFAYQGTAFGSGDGSTTFNLANSGGEFDRNWTSAQTIDSGRTFGSTQADGVGPHTHVYTSPGGAVADAGSGCCGISSTANTTSGPTPGTTETRPKNITVLSCIVTGQYQ